MASSDNPAARLYDLLDALHRQPSNANIGAAWADVLNVDRRNVPRALAPLGGLLFEIESRVAQMDTARVNHLWNQFHRSWEKAVLTPDVGHAQSLDNIKDGSALAALGALAVIFGTDAPVSPSVEDTEEVASLRADLASAIAEVVADTNLASPIRTLLLQRLHDIAWALDHIEVVGPDGVKAAAERLAGALMMEDTDEKDLGLLKNVVLVARKVWWVVSMGSTLPDAIEGWTEVARMLPGGPPPA